MTRTLDDSRSSKDAVRPRVGVFQANWPLQVHTTNVLEMLTRRGYAVDLFVYGVSQDFATLTGSLANDNVAVFDLSDATVGSRETSGAASVRQTIMDSARRRRSLRPVIKVARWLRSLGDAAKYLLRIDDLNYVLAPWVFVTTERYTAGRTYKLFIGVEREGLVWAGEMARRLNIPCAYFSLELYTNDSPHFKGRRFRRLKRLERLYHRRCRATIVQDAPRAKVLFGDNRVTPSIVHFVPVSLLGEARTRKSRYLHEKLGLKSDARIVLVLGQVDAKRYTHDAVAAAQEFPEEWVLVVHGPAFGDARLLEELTRLNTAGRARISTDLMPESELGDLVASADVGVALYSDATQNEYWTGRASEKVARYAQAGVPMIAFDYPSFREVFERYGCGRVISDFGQFRHQLHVIFENHDAYRAGAFTAYAEVYEFSKHFSSVVNWIDQL